MASQQDGSPVTPTPLQRHSGVDRSSFSLHPPRLSIGSGHHYRFADFDEGSFSESAGVSAEQAKRALRAHLAETERRMAEAGRLGTALVQQQKELTEKLQEVETLQEESELSPELKKKLAELEKEYDDVARETARAFLPKKRVPSNESTDSPDARGRRSLSPSKYETHASGSPSKLTVSNRRQRNQNSNRVHDIEFAAEISTSLISQVRGLQALLAEREEDLRDTKQDLARLEDTADTMRERIKELDEGEHRYKEENWNLETRIHDLDAAQRDASDKDKKMAQQLAILQADKVKTQRELDELKGVHARLVDEHAAIVKLNDIELGTAKRSIILADGEKATMQRKIDELTGLNQELARAVSMQQRVQSVIGEAVPAKSDEDADTSNDQGTPDHSPPASPVKGTPRHPGLETETLKTSLLHAQRTVQSLRTNLHREKTEKLELRRLLQETRDDLERVRADPNTAAAAAAAAAIKKNRKDVRENQKQLRPSQLGGPRSSRTELFIIASNDPDWEEIESEPSPSGSAARARRRGTETSDQFDTANEGVVSDASFATANEGAETTTDAFHTGAEDLSSDEETMTETDQRPRGRALSSRGSGSVSTARGPPAQDPDAANQSTASTSDDEFKSPRTPTASTSGSTSHMRTRSSRSTLASHRIRRMASIEDPGSSPAGLQASPFSATGSPGVGLGLNSINSTPRVIGLQQSLFAELEELNENSDEDMASEGTPIRFRSPRSLTPSAIARTRSTSNLFRGRSPLAQVLSTSKVVMVDRATLTDSVTILPWSEEEERQEQLGGLAPESRPTSFLSDISMGERLKEFPSPPLTSVRGLALSPIILSPPPSKPIEVGQKTEDDSGELQAVGEPPLELAMSVIVSVPIEPVAEPVIPPSPIILALSSVLAEHVVPLSPSEPEPPVFTSSALHAVNVSPIETEVPEPPTFSLSVVLVEQVEPISEPEPEEAVPVPMEPFSFTAMQSQYVEPIAEPEPAPPVWEPFSVSTVQSQYVEPIAEPEKALPPVEPFAVSGLLSQHIEPVSEPERALPPLEPFSFSAVQVQHVQPVSEPEPVRALPVPEPFSFSDVQTQQVEPISEPEKALPIAEPFSVSGVLSQHVEPISEPEREVVPLEPFSYTGVQSQEIQPVSEPEPPVLPPPSLSVSAVQVEDVEPVSVPEEPLPKMAVSGVFSQDVEPDVIAESEDEKKDLVAVAAPLVSVNSIGTQTDEWKPVLLPGAIATLGAAAVAGGVFTGHEVGSVISDGQRSPKRNAFIIPRDGDELSTATSSPESRQAPTTPSKSARGPLIGGWSKHTGPPTPVIAEDETQQSPSTDYLSETPESDRVFKEISANANSGNVVRSIAAEEPVRSLEAIGATPYVGSKPAKQSFAVGAMGQNVLEDGTGSSIKRGKAIDATGSAALHRPGSATSNRLSTDFLPPLPANHREVIEAARSGSAGSMGSSGPAAVAAPGGMATWRAQTPTGAAAREFHYAHYTGTPTPKANVRNGAAGVGELHAPSRPSSRMNASNAGGSVVPGAMGSLSRQTSVSSFASEVNARFNIHDGDVFGSGASSHIDPRMIQAITQTMIGEYLWKYTRKTGRSGMSEKRHRRYFWIHPYTRMLYWSDQGPSADSRVEQRAKSVVIEGVRVVTDDNPMPPGLHRKSLVVISPGRTIKFTCSTGHGHEVWFNALSYLLLRKEEGAEDEGMTANGEQITREDVEEFNPAFGHRAGASSAQARRQPPVSLSSYNSRTTHNESPAFGMTMNVPTLTPTPKKNTNGRFSIRSHRQSNNVPQESGIYEASEVNDSAEDARALFVAQDREAGRLENVRACCDGKHDVGTLSHSTRRNRHSQQPTSTMSTPTHSTVRHRP
ncbi:nuclear migration protein [Grosmannia clavigera kw1407]|uniref:Nuclear migration protein n=1 Tax=Grosmannia clavigera (strain kw1407 / UAMH 11150) TaxID=655863 RepID=F0XBM9_GROCL|nr:nuclear migration protein [Grosmannia clavigera kw1407]EFX05079.1 nuclear migration protein [Grosmannia clavigera kw1407]